MPHFLDQSVVSGWCGQYCACHLYFPDNFQIPILGLVNLGSEVIVFLMSSEGVVCTHDSRANASLWLPSGNLNCMSGHPLREVCTLDSWPVGKWAHHWHSASLSRCLPGDNPNCMCLWHTLSYLMTRAFRPSEHNWLKHRGSTSLCLLCHVIPLLWWSVLLS